MGSLQVISEDILQIILLQIENYRSCRLVCKKWYFICYPKLGFYGVHYNLIRNRSFITINGSRYCYISIITELVSKYFERNNILIIKQLIYNNLRFPESIWVALQKFPKLYLMLNITSIELLIQFEIISYTNYLPLDILQIILLQIKDYMACRLVCKKWYYICYPKISYKNRFNDEKFDNICQIYYNYDLMKLFSKYFNRNNISIIKLMVMDNKYEKYYRNIIYGSMMIAMQKYPELYKFDLMIVNNPKIKYPKSYKN